MNKFISFLNLIRFNNLLIVILTQIVIKIFLIDAYLNNSALSILQFCLYLLALISVVAGGYIINDICDIEIDKINKPSTRIINKEISVMFAMRIYYITNFIGVTISFFVAHNINRFSFGFIFIFMAFSLWKYSKEYKTKFLIGNLQVAFLTALSIIIIALFDILPLGISNNNGTKIIFNIILLYAGFSFVITLIREIIKDLEDTEGDQKIGANTLAIEYGIKKTKQIIAFLILIPIFGVGYFQYFQYSVLNSQFSIEINYWGVNPIEVFYTSLIQILLIILLRNIGRAKTKANFHKLSKLCKAIMILGILSIPLFHFLYQI